MINETHAVICVMGTEMYTKHIGYVCVISMDYIEQNI